MSTTLEARAPSARCYQCGSVHIGMVCHQCGEPICQRHGTIPKDKSNKPLNQEFTWILGPGKAPYHCAEHEHIVKGRVQRLIWICAGVTILGIILVTVATTLGVILLLAGLGGGALAVVTDRNRATAIRDTRPPLPLTPSIESVRINETVTGRLTLDEHGSYQNPVDSVAGELVVATTLGKNDRDRLADYRTKYQVGDEDVEFAAGFVVLDGQMGLDFLDGQRDRPIIPMAGKVSEIPFLGADGGRTTGLWNIRRDYELKPATKIDQLPIWLTPSVRAASDRRNLELELQWVDFLPDDVTLEVDTVAKLTIRVPMEWGHIESVTPPDASIGEAGGYIELNRVRPQRDEQRLKVFIQFENKIGMTDTIRGNLEIVFKNTMSGVRGVTVYNPLGHQRQVAEKKIESHITLTADFELSLAGIRYQDHRVVPDRKFLEGSDKLETETFQGVVPDFETVVALTNAMSEQGYYVKSVIENPPSSSARASVVNRAWDISGRRYDGVYPVDFHIVLTGEEVHQGDIRAHSGNTTMRMTVQGTFASEPMEKMIELAWEALHDLVKETLEDRLHSARPTTTDEPDQQEEPVVRRPTNDSRAARLQRIDDALLAGRITEQRYQEMRARIETDMDEDS